MSDQDAPLAGVTVIGGAGGTSAHLDDLDAAAAALERAADLLDASAHAAHDVAELVEEAAAWSPATAPLARVLTDPLVDPWRGARAAAASVRATAAALRTAADLYRRADLDVAGRLRNGGILAGSVLGEAGPVAWLAVGALAAVGAVGVAIHVTSVRALQYTPGVGGLVLRGLGAGPLAGASGPVGWVSRLYGGPGLVPSGLGPPTVGTVETLVPGMSSFLLAAGPGRSHLLGRDPVPLAAASIGNGTRVATLLLGTPTSGLLMTRAIQAASSRPPERAPQGMGDVLDDVHARYPDPHSPGAGGLPGSVGVQRLDHSDGSASWVVTIPGTEEWSPLAGQNPLDLQTDLDVVAGRPDDATELVTRAMIAAGVPPDEPVLLAGHSLGGIVAMEMAQDRAFQERFSVAAVLTAGSPVGAGESADLPPGVQTLHLEHEQDYVHGLDGRPNGDRPRSTTVRADLGRAPWVSDPTSAGSPVQAHAASGYAETARAIEGSDHPSIQAFEAAVGRVLGTSGHAPVVSSSTSTYVGVRVP
ncbi:MAG: alpha/beta hydrolase [Actinotalea sp.]|nr:alpha/beta hydrolase [Actinotalea sp.]